MPGAKVRIEFVGAEVGGRTAPARLSAAYRPHFRVGTGDYLGVVFTGNEVGVAQVGQCINAEVDFVYVPAVDYGALVVGAQFQILEGARVVGVGQVVEVLP